jgi:hypothetical protein
MRERIATPCFPLPRGEEAPELGGESPVTSPRALLGHEILNGRFLLRRKVGHSRTTVRFAAHDLMADMEVAVHLHPDHDSATGYRLGQTGVAEPRPDLPSLCSTRFAADAAPPRLAVRPQRPSDRGMSRVWTRFRSLFGRA